MNMEFPRRVNLELLVVRNNSLLDNSLLVNGSIVLMPWWNPGATAVDRREVSGSMSQPAILANANAAGRGNGNKLVFNSQSLAKSAMAP